MVCLSRPYSFQVFKACLPQNLVNTTLEYCVLIVLKNFTMEFTGDN